MKKLLGIIVLSLLFGGNAFAEKCKSELNLKLLKYLPDNQPKIYNFTFYNNSPKRYLIEKAELINEKNQIVKYANVNRIIEPFTKESYRLRVKNNFIGNVKKHNYTCRTIKKSFKIEDLKKEKGIFKNILGRLIGK
tara:strand:- start:420 stop:827 length:408 start_codon:yes stop_codon:yes gene_type:complete